MMVNEHQECPMTPESVRNLTEQVTNHSCKLDTINKTLEEINKRSQQDHIELARREATFKDIPELQKEIKQLNESFNCGRGAIWIILALIGFASIFVADVFTFLKGKIL